LDHGWKLAEPEDAKAIGIAETIVFSAIALVAPYLTEYHSELSAANNILQRALAGASRCIAEPLGGAAILSIHSAQLGQQDMP
jgi:hypothetical protein